MSRPAYETLTAAASIWPGAAAEPTAGIAIPIAKIKGIALLRNIVPMILSPTSKVTRGPPTTMAEQAEFRCTWYFDVWGGKNVARSNEQIVI
jgi:hypothetical protein